MNITHLSFGLTLRHSLGQCRSHVVDEGIRLHLGLVGRKVLLRMGPHALFPVPRDARAEGPLEVDDGVAGALEGRRVRRSVEPVLAMFGLGKGDDVGVGHHAIQLADHAILLSAQKFSKMRL